MGLVANDSALPARPPVPFAFAFALTVAALADAVAASFALALRVVSTSLVAVIRILALLLRLPWAGGTTPGQVLHLPRRLHRVLSSTAFFC